MTFVDVKENPVVQTADPEDHDKLAHIVVPAYKVTEAYITGTPVTALCGKVWVPTRDPEKYPVCEPCKEMLQLMRSFNE